MSDNLATPEIKAESAETPQMNFFQRLVGIYFEPKKTFQDTKRKGAWLWIFLIACALSVGSYYALRSRMDYETLFRKGLQMNPFTRNLSEEQIKPLLARPESAFQRYSQIVLIPVGALALYLALAGIFLLLFVLMGGAINYKKSLTATIWAMAPPGIVLMILSIVFVFIKDPDTLDINPAGNVVSNLGPLVDSKAQPVLASLLSSIDLFSFWTIALLSIGFSTMSEERLTTKKAATGILILWLLYVLAKLGITALFS